MRNRFLHALSVTTWLLAANLLGCGDGGTTGSDVPDTKRTNTPIASSPRIAFVVAKDGHVREVTEIVYFERFATRISGLMPGTEVTLIAHMYAPGQKGRGFTSEATFVADAAGTADTGTAAPIRGSYTGIDPDASFWSMTEGPIEEGLGENRGAAFFEARVGDTIVAKATLQRLAVATNVEMQIVTQNGLVGEYFFPKGVTDRVPVVAFGGSEGGISGGESYAYRMATMGYPTMAVAYFGEAGVPSELSDIPLEYFEKAFAWLDGRSETRKGKVVVMGGSRGGELALQLGATFPSVVGVVAETPSAYRWGGLSSTAIDGGNAWTHQGKPLAKMPNRSTNVRRVKDPNGKTAYVFRDSFLEEMRLATPEELESARIAVERTRGEILMVGGGDDQLWPACDFIDVAMKRLTESGHTAQYRDKGICYPKSGHAVGSLGLPTSGMDYAKVGSTIYVLGGTPEATAQAGRDVEEKIRELLDRVSR